MEIGITGGEEDGVDNSDVKAEKLYTQPEQVWNVHKALSAIGPCFSIAAAFGNVHGVYKAGNVVLSPHLLGGHQEFIQKQLGCTNPKPAFLVMHGGSGSTQDEIQMAVKNGVICLKLLRGWRRMRNPVCCSLCLLRLLVCHFCCCGGKG